MCGTNLLPLIMFVCVCASSSLVDLQPDVSPEPLESFTAANQSICVNMCGNHSCGSVWPVPSCVRSCKTAPAEWTRVVCSKGNTDQHYNRTISLIRFVANRNKISFKPGVFCERLLNVKVRLDMTTLLSPKPLMGFDEFELFSKTLAQAMPTNYLEWGAGMSTSVFPFLFSSQAYVIEHDHSWCNKIATFPTVRCLRDLEQRLNIFCVRPRYADGSLIELYHVGLPRKDVELFGAQYVNQIDRIRLMHVDVALVDGRFRLACALKLLNYLRDSSLLFIHDFWHRTSYHKVLDYYNVIGSTRSLVVLQKKWEGLLPEGWQHAYQSHLFDMS